jgi:site-specific recombinase XerD
MLGGYFMKKILAVTSKIYFRVIRKAGKVSDIKTNSPEIAHFLNLLRLTRSFNTWLNYAQDFKIFFDVVRTPLEAIGRPECLQFIDHQSREGRSHATINRRIAAVSSLFHELNLLDPVRFPKNPVYPLQRKRHKRRHRMSLYRKQSVRLPDIVATETLKYLFRLIRTWRDRTLILLMWISCLRVSEAVSIRFDDIECSHRLIRIRDSKGGLSRIIYMDTLTFQALNRYLDDERGDLSPNENHIFVALKGIARGKPLSVNSVQKLLMYYVKTRGLDRIHPHLLRHTGITQLLEQGMSEPSVRTFVGHRHPASLLPYVHLSDTHVAAEFDHAQRGLELGHLHVFNLKGEDK